jgi:hypothetical protein
VTALAGTIFIVTGFLVLHKLGNREAQMAQKADIEKYEKAWETAKDQEAVSRTSIQEAFNNLTMMARAQSTKMNLQMRCTRWGCSRAEKLCSSFSESMTKTARERLTWASSAIWST